MCARVSTRERKRDLVRDVNIIHSSLNCLVYPGFFYHKIVSGLKNDVKNIVVQKVWNQIIDSNEKMDHQDINPGTALILSNAGRLIIISNESPWASTIYLQNVGLVLEHTRFGYVIRGKVTQCLASTVRDVQMGCFSPTIQTRVGGATSCYPMGLNNT